MKITIHVHGTQMNQAEKERTGSLDLWGEEHNRRIIFTGYKLHQVYQIAEKLNKGDQIRLELDAVLKGDPSWGYNFEDKKKKF